MTMLGRSASTDSLLMAWPLLVTTGRSAASGKVVEMSRPTTESPNPSANTVEAIDPAMSSGRMRLVSSTVTTTSPARSRETTVVGSCCAGASATGVIDAVSSTAVDGPR